MGKCKYLLMLLLLGLPVPGFSQQGSVVSLAPLDFGIKQTVVTLTTSATAIPTTALAGRKSMIIKNINSSVTVYLGSSTVTADETSTGGFQLDSNDIFQADLGENTVIYGIVSSGTAKVVIIEVR